MTTRKAAGEKSQTLPPQHQQHQPGIETQMHPLPASGMENYPGAGKLRDKGYLDYRW